MKIYTETEKKDKLIAAMNECRAAGNECEWFDFTWDNDSASWLWTPPMACNKPEKPAPKFVSGQRVTVERRCTRLPAIVEKVERVFYSFHRWYVYYTVRTDAGEVFEAPEGALKKV